MRRGIGTSAKKCRATGENLTLIFVCTVINVSKTNDICLISVVFFGVVHFIFAIAIAIFTRLSHDHDENYIVRMKQKQTNRGKNKKKDTANEKEK